MFKFEYEIKIGENGRPFVDQSKNNEVLPEHKFMAVEMTRYMMQQLLIDNQNLFEKEKVRGLNDDQELRIVEAGMTLEVVADQIAMMLIESKNALDDLGLDVKED